MASMLLFGLRLSWEQRAAFQIVHALYPSVLFAKFKVKGDNFT